LFGGRGKKTELQAKQHSGYEFIRFDLPNQYEILSVTSGMPSMYEMRRRNIYRVIHEVLPSLREGIPEVIWNNKCYYTNGSQLIIKDIQ
jgi:hypothetical protein